MYNPTVEIHIRRIEAEDGINAVGIVVPAMLKNIDDKDSVRFVNCTHEDPQGVQVWLPVECYEEGETILELPNVGDEKTIHITRKKVDHRGKVDAEEEVMYKVWCERIREFAVGNSPPKMKIVKP